jgi:hypothetical protein
MYTGFWWAELTERDDLEHLGAGWRIVIKWNFKQGDGGAWAGLIWLRTGTKVGLL